MKTLSEQEIIDRINAGRRFAATIDSGAFRICVARYVPAVVTAVHDGHEVPEETARQMLVGDAERYFEEDPHTGTIAASFAVSLVMLHSRYFYDINRRPEICIYQEAWGKQVWRERPVGFQNAAIIGLHRSYYRVMDALLTELERRFHACAVYDLHSYNYSRLAGKPPLFNIGTHFVDNTAFQPAVDALGMALGAITVPGVVNRTACDEVFAGKGYQAEYIRTHHPASLCLPIEIKKAFMDEVTGELYPERFQALHNEVTVALAGHASFFARYSKSGSFEPTAFLLPDLPG